MSANLVQDKEVSPGTVAPAAPLTRRAKADADWALARVRRVGLAVALVYTEPDTQSDLVARLIAPSPYACYVIPWHKLSAKEQAAAQEAHPDLRWYQIRLAANDQVGWVRSDVAEVTLLQDDVAAERNGSPGQRRVALIKLQEERAALYERLSKNAEAMATLYRRLAEEAKIP